MKWSKRLLILFLIASNFDSSTSKKLSTEENEKRLAHCGTKHQRSKVFNGRETNEEEAPWAVQVFSPNSSCTGTLISPRHVSTTTHCIAGHDDVEWKNNSLNYNFDRNKCPKHNHIVITEVLASKVAVLSNKTLIGRGKFLILFGFCRVANEDYFYQYADDFMIIELADDVEYSQTLHPACVARDTSDNRENSVLDFYGYGQNPDRDQKEKPESGGILRFEQTKVIDETPKGTRNRIDPRVFHARSVTEMSVNCPGDSGGGATRKIDGRVTVVGTLMRSTCVFMKRGKDAYEVYASVGYHAKYLCKYTGICTPPRSSAGGFSILVPLFLLSIVFL